MIKIIRTTFTGSTEHKVIEALSEVMEGKLEEIDECDILSTDLAMGTHGNGLKYGVMVVYYKEDNAA